MGDVEAEPPADIIPPPPVDLAPDDGGDLFGAPPDNAPVGTDIFGAPAAGTDDIFGAPAGGTDIFGAPLPPPGGLIAGDLFGGENLGLLSGLPVDGGGVKVRPSTRYEEKAVITRLHMLEYASQLAFTLVMWCVFIYILYTRAGVTQSFNLHLSVMQHMENIVAHPHLSGIRIREVEDNPLPCKCACQSSSAGMPKGPCDPHASEALEFLGQLNRSSPRNLKYMPAWTSGLGDKLDTGNDEIAPMTWDRISEPADVWFWIEHGFIPDIWRPRSQSGGNATALQGLIAQKNLIIGGVRARQERATWSTDCESKVPGEVKTFYGTSCRSSEPATGMYGPAGSNETAFYPSLATETLGVYDALFDVERNITDALETATFARKNNWISAVTRTLTLQAVTLNAEVGMFAIVDIQFKFPSAGGVEKRVYVHTIHATGSQMEPMDYIPEIMWAFLICILLRQEIWQAGKAGYYTIKGDDPDEAPKQKCMDYWLDMWCLVDWISILLGILITVFWLWQMDSIGTISTAVAAMPRAPFAEGQPSDIPGYRASWQIILDDAAYVFERKSYYQLLLFWYNLILACRFLKGFLSQAKLAMMQMTVGTVFWDLCHLFVFFGMLFLNFMQGGHILFGAELEEWSTMVFAGATTVRMLLGTYAFDPMYEVAPAAATCWFWGFLLSVGFILMNLIFAMIADYFHMIRASIGDTDTLWLDVRNALVDLWWRMGWRKINFEDGEYKIAFCEDPYGGVADGLMQVCEVPAKMEEDAGATCLGVRIGRRHMEDQSIEGLTAALNPGYKEATSKGIQEFDADIMAADHLLELAAPHVEIETKRKNESQLTMIRHFVHLLRDHAREIDTHCAGLEAEATSDHGVLTKSLDYLEENVRNCLEEFERLKDTGVHSLAPPMQALPRPGTLAAHEAQQQSLVAPGALLRAIEVHTKPPWKPKDAPEPPEPPLGVEVNNLINSGNENLLALGNAPAPPSNLPVAPMLTNQPAAQVVGNSAPEGGMLELTDNRPAALALNN